MVIRSRRLACRRGAEVVCIGVDVPAYYETSNNLLSFPTHFPFKISRSQKSPVSARYSFGLISVRKETQTRASDLFATTSVCVQTLIYPVYKRYIRWYIRVYKGVPFLALCFFGIPTRCKINWY